LGIKHQIFNNGNELIYELNQTSKDDIGLIITDIEMPVLNGKEVVKILTHDEKYRDINILVFTNMSNHIMEAELLQMGVAKVITKIDIKALAKTINEYIKI